MARKKTEDDEPEDKEEGPAKDEGEVEVVLKEEDEEDEEEGGEARTARPDDEERASRAARRAERSRTRYREVETRAREAAERAERLEAALQEERTRRTVENTILRSAMPQGRDGYDERMDGIRERMRNKLEVLKGVRDDAAANSLAMEYQELQGELEDVRIERAMARSQRQQQRSAGNENFSHEQRLLQYEFPDVFTDGRRKQWAAGTYEQLIADGDAPGLETAKKAARMTRQKYAGGRSAPATTEQRRYAGVSSSGGGPPADNTVRLTDRRLRKIARAANPKDDEDVAYKKFARKARNAGIV